MQATITYVKVLALNCILRAFQLRSIPESPSRLCGIDAFPRDTNTMLQGNKRSFSPFSDKHGPPSPVKSARNRRNIKASACSNCYEMMVKYGVGHWLQSRTLRDFLNTSKSCEFCDFLYRLFDDGTFERLRGNFADLSQICIRIKRDRSWFRSHGMVRGRNHDVEVLDSENNPLASASFALAEDGKLA